MTSKNTPSSLRELLREGDRFTDRNFMAVLGIGHPMLKRLEADPSLFSMADLQALATLTGHSLKKLVELVIAEMERNPAVAEKREEVALQTVGRKIAPAGAAKPRVRKRKTS
jgi:hypothetical protein